MSRYETADTIATATATATNNRKVSQPTISHVHGFDALNDELDYVIPYSDVKGEVPATIRGTFFRIGPGRNKIGNDKFGHWFDGDGMMNAVSFTDAGVIYRNKYVRTPKYRAESKANKIVMRSFGHNAPGGILKNVGRLPANCANTSLVYHGDKLLALWEGGRPWRLDPATLDTIGPFDYHGRLGKANAFSAHGKVNARTGAYFNFGVRPSFTPKDLLQGKGAIDLYKVSPSGHIVQKGAIETDYLSFCHDYALTENYMIFFVSPIAMKSAIPWLAGVESFDQAISWQPELGMKVYVVRTADFKLARTFTVSKPFIAIHFSNAWETSNGQIHLDLTRFEDFSVNELLRDVFNRDAKGAAGTFWRYTLDLAQDEMVAQQHKNALPGEFPQWDPRRTTLPTRYLYAACMMSDKSTFFDGVQRIDTSSGEVISHGLGGGRFTSEAMFIPDETVHQANIESGESETKGWLISMVYDANVHRSEVVIFDAQTLDEVAIVPLQNHVPFGFHCGYTAKSFLIYSLP
ncbi:MAG: carotenoid oxygenase family protein [Pseudomonadales bacterium]|nr:carotenoid oxygenase family protein [Pseudomonadales bacterium]